MKRARKRTRGMRRKEEDMKKARKGMRARKEKIS